MTIDEYARHRKCARNVVQYALRAGRLTRSARKDRKGRWVIDAAAADVEWAQTTRSDRVPRVGPTAPHGDELEAPEDYAAVRLRRETAEAEKAEIAVAKMKGELVPAADVLAKMQADYSAVRTKLMGIPAAFRQRVPEAAASQVAVLDGLIREGLEDLAAGDDQGRAVA